MIRLKSYTSIVLFILLSGHVLCDDNDIISKVATSGANWLKLETDARAVGMGGAYTAMGSGISGVPYNPASIAFVSKQEGFLSHTNYIAGISYSVLGYSQNMNQEGTDYFGVHLFLSSSIEDVKLAIESNVAAATIIQRSCENKKESSSGILKIAFDGDAVIFSDESEKVFHEKGLEAF